MKKIVALLFALVMAFSVCACSQPAPAEAESGSEEQSQPAGVLADAAMGSLQVRPVSSAGAADGLLGKSLFA